MEFNPYKDLIIPMAKRQEARKPAEVEDFKFPEFNLRRVERLGAVHIDAPAAPRIDAPGPVRAGGDAPGPVRADGGDGGPSLSGAGTRASSQPSGAGAAGEVTVPKNDASVKEAKVNEDGSIEITKADGTKETIQPLSRESPPPKESIESVKSKETPEESTARESEKSALADKLLKGMMLLPAFLPLALLLAGFIQGEIACNDINGGGVSGHGPKVMSITNVKSAQWPTGMPSWFPVTNSTKVDLTYSPCIEILKTDKLTVTDSSNVLTGTYGVESTPGPCQVRIDIKKGYTANTASNTATFTDKTSCSDRMAYAIGQDANTILSTAGTGLSGAASGFFSAVPWSSILMFIAFILAIYIAWSAIKVFKG